MLQAPGASKISLESCGGCKELWCGQKHQQLLRLLPGLFFKDNKWRIPDPGFSSALDVQKYYFDVEGPRCLNGLSEFTQISDVSLEVLADLRMSHLQNEFI